MNLEYPARTEKNIVESDGTLVLNVGRLPGGTRMTVDCPRKHGRSFLVVAFNGQPKIEDVVGWVELHGIKTPGLGKASAPGCTRSRWSF